MTNLAQANCNERSLEHALCTVNTSQEEISIYQRNPLISATICYRTYEHCLLEKKLLVTENATLSRSFWTEIFIKWDYYLAKM